MTELVSKENFYLGCRVCRQLLPLKGNSSVNLSDIILDLNISYSQVLLETCNIDTEESLGLPQRICADCVAKLIISYQIMKEAFESDKILKDYAVLEKSENEVYEKYKFIEEEFEYEEIEQLDDDKVMDVQSTSDMDGDGDAVSFLTGILKTNTDDEKLFVEVRKEKPKSISRILADDPSRKHACNVCHRKFQKRSNLIDHLRLHANVKVYACDHCEKSFVQAGNYKAHLRTHTKEKPFACEYCNKSYSQSSSLKIHIRSHTKEKNYICLTCDKAFSNASDLGKHRLIHDPVKKYHCHLCQRPFTQKVHIRKHFDKHHPDLDLEECLKKWNNEKYITIKAE